MRLTPANQDAFLDGKADVIVVTIAFEMGILNRCTLCNPLTFQKS